jgi:hypothetical protein
MSKRSSKGRKRSSGGKRRVSKGSPRRSETALRKQDADHAKRAIKHLTLAYSEMSGMKVYSRHLEDVIDEVSDKLNEMKTAILKGAKHVPHSSAPTSVYSK